MDHLQQAPYSEMSAEIADLDRAASRFSTSLPGGGEMVWRCWGEGAPILLLHGGHGSWLHWLRTIPALSQHRRVIAPDLPGFGSSDSLPEGYRLEDVACAVTTGLARIIAAEQCVIVGFSFGGVVAGQVAELLLDRVDQLVLIGSGGFGLNRPQMAPLCKWRGLRTEERLAAHRRNLEILMFADVTKIDAVAIEIQAFNAEHARGISRAFSRTDTLARSLLRQRIRVDGIWGSHDATALGFLDERETFLRLVNPASRLIRIEGAGHWVQYEAADSFQLALSFLLQER